MSKPVNTPGGKDVRCVCGRLTARLEKRGVVVKCHRCGEFLVIALADLPARLTRPAEPQPPA